MKKLLILLLLAQIGYGQTVSVPTKEYIDAQVRGLNARIDSTIKAIKPGVPPVALPACPAGPVINGISNVTSTSAEVLFHGEGVFSIEYEVIRDGGSRVVLDSVRPTSNKVTINFPPQSDGTFNLLFRGKSCKSVDDKKQFQVKSNSGGVVNPPVVNPPVPVQNSKVIGAESVKVGGRTYTFNQTPELKLQFNQDGTISDISQGLDNSGAHARINGENVFYMIGYSWFEGPNGEYQKFQNIKLPDGVYAIKQFVCKPLKVSNYETFKKNLSNNTDNGVHELNARMSQIFLTIKSDQKVGQGIVKDWLVVSRTLNYPSALPPIDWRPYNKFFANGILNRGDDQDVYRRVGTLPGVRPGQPNQAGTWLTVKTGQNVVLNPQQAYNYGYEWAGYFGGSPDSYITEELVENGQGGYDVPGAPQDGYSVSLNFAKGNFDRIRRDNPNINKKNTGIYGGYGGDNYYGLLNDDLLTGDRATYEQSLTSHLYKGRGVNGWGSEDHPYFTKGHIDVRNVNAKYYFWNKIYHLPYEFIALNERLKLATKTYGGVDKESNLSIFSAPFIESFVTKPLYGKINIEEASTGELIEYPNGTVLTKNNTGPPMAMDAAFTAGFWSFLINNGIAMWDAPNSTFGGDATKIDIYSESDQWFAFRKKGETNFQKLVSGQNGAPVISIDGLKNSLYSSPIDAAAAGMQVAWEIRNRTTKLSFISYTSDRGDFIAKPGTGGFHLNGFGPPNRNLFVVKDAFDQHRAICLVGEGSEGAVFIYHNGFLSAHLSERVKIQYNGTLYDLGEIYGQQTVIKKL